MLVILEFENAEKMQKAKNWICTTLGQKCRLRNVKIRMQKFLISFSAAGLLGFLEVTTTPIKHLQSHWKKYSFLLIRKHKPYENSFRFLVREKGYHDMCKCITTLCFVVVYITL